MSGSTSIFRMRLPATSANLGSGFDAAAVALNFFLEIEAAPAETFSISATGEDADLCARVEDNLILGIYQRILRENRKPLTPLAVRMRNSIPLGMGCGSSAAGRLAAIAMAVHFGGLDWKSERILEEACALEGHPDNAAACWLGGFVAAASEERKVYVARVVPPASWRAIVVLPPDSLATSKARAVLPNSYSSDDVVANIQAVSLLGLAFAQSRGDLLRVAMKDRIHQPYRLKMCPMLPRLFPLAGTAGILGVGLSGAGPAVLVIVDKKADLQSVSTAIQTSLDRLPHPRLITSAFEEIGAEKSFRKES
ncbi:homoserine kinase [Telmatobacter sp. DSM 110680]|uniref:Homoserine kinase n=1 Tax=Telmatobacter sp. DSM 110680 TaxID=3036704 RepID=A0AAU7DGU2_9BACT